MRPIATATTLSVHPVRKREQVPTVLLPHSFPINLLQLSTRHNDLLTILLNLRDHVFAQVQFLEAAQSCEKRQDLVLQISDPVASEVQSLDPVAEIESLALDDVIV